jgi:DNA polymerase-3 subunit alpha
MAKKYELTVIATNDIHYVEKEDSEAHDLLLALQTGKDYADPNRFRFTDDKGQLLPEFYFKTKEEMLEIFQDIPFALDNTLQLADKCTFELNLGQDMIMPQYKVPEGFSGMDAYLAHLTWERARQKYGIITAEIEERINFELRTIQEKGYAGYFLIVQSFTTEARKRGVYVGPGRGSAAGSLIAYVLGIIDIDPLKYDLLFERFLNPERISPPDIDIDFDDEGRQEVIDFVVEEYGRNSVSQVITYGTMGAKTALRDVGRTLGIPLAEVNRIAKLIPDRPGMTFDKAIDPDSNPDFAGELKTLFDHTDTGIRKMMRFARTLEGTARHTGVHACAVIIAPGDVTDYAPIAVAKDKSYVTQYDGPHAEMVGLLKMDFLGLKTLSIIKTAIHLVKDNRGIEIDPDTIDLEDEATFELYQRGETIATFQFESDGMRKYLRQLKPTNIEDLIAMNALYRPGPMDNIPHFVNRKHGREKIDYPHEMLEPILRNTYGIMVYQEQIMQVAQKMAGYSLGQADLLRRAMGKKKKEVMAKERGGFVSGALERGVDEATAEDVFNLMEKFASYGFNKSHAAAYSVLAFKTAFLKAHYPEEYMASVLTHNVNEIKKITFFIEECRRMGIEVLPPDVNESKGLFSVNKKGQIRFGLEAIKGVGKSVAEQLIAERESGGPFLSIYDIASRMPLRSINRKVLESLAYAGAFDVFEGIKRYQYFLPASDREEMNVLEKALSWGTKVQVEKNSLQGSLFGDMGDNGHDLNPEPAIPIGSVKDGKIQEMWTKLEMLNFEKEVIGFYLSGHPLDKYKWQLDAYPLCPIADLDDNRNKEIHLAGIVTSVRERKTKSGNRFLSFIFEDFTESMELVLFGDDYGKFRSFVQQDEMLLISGTYGPPPSWKDQSEYEMKVKEMQFLSDELFEKMTRHVHLNLQTNELDDELVQRIETLFRNNPGKHPLKFSLIDPGIPARVGLISSAFTVKPARQVIEELTDLGLSFSLV